MPSAYSTPAFRNCLSRSVISPSLDFVSRLGVELAAPRHAAERRACLLEALDHGDDFVHVRQLSGEAALCVGPHADRQHLTLLVAVLLPGVVHDDDLRRLRM